MFLKLSRKDRKCNHFFKKILHNIALNLISTKAILDIRQNGITVLVAEQYARPLLPHIDRGYILENGSLVTSGAGSELMDDPEVKLAYFGV